MANWLAKLLRAENYVVDCVPDGETAVSGVSLGSYDLALVDLALPGMSGLEVWPAPGSEDTELGVLMEPEVDHGEAEVHAGVQA